MSSSRWVEVPVEPWVDASGLTEDRIYLAFEPLLPQANDPSLEGVRAWVRLVVADVFHGDTYDCTFRHVNVGTDWRKLLGAQLQGFDDKTSGIYYVDGRAVKLERQPTALPSLPEHLVSALRDQWLKDYGEELGP